MRHNALPHRIFRFRAVFAVFPFAAVLAVTNADAGSATWSLNPTTSAWGTAANWSPMTVPNGPSDTATFGVSNLPSVNVSARITVHGVVFNSEASAYTITDDAPQTMSITGAGISNNSGIEQQFQISDVAEINLANSATITGPVVIDVLGNPEMFGNSAGSLLFTDTASAGDATITADTSNSVYIATVDFYDSSTAENAIITARGGATADQRFNGVISFLKNASAANATITCEGGSWSSGDGGSCYFYNNATAGSATITANGGTVSGADGGKVQFISGRTENATLIANGGTNGGLGGQLIIDNPATGTQPRVELFGDGNLNIIFGVTIGSVEGDGLVYLGGSNLTVGSNGLSTLFSGVIQDGGFSQQDGGSFTKTGSGTLTLTGASLYTGGTTINEGALVVSNQTGSGTGTAGVSVNGGTLGGTGIISGAVTVGTGSGGGAVLAPAFGTNKQATLTLQSSLTLQADATYTYTFKARKNQSRTDLVVANGITINNASIALQGKIQGQLKRGLVLTVLNNTSANPISGTFSNLADGAIINVNGNNLQASYTGGDGNDLTLTVVP